jgi:hypothetical protein
MVARFRWLETHARSGVFAAPGIRAIEGETLLLEGVVGRVPLARCFSGLEDGELARVGEAAGRALAVLHSGPPPVPGSAQPIDGILPGLEMGGGCEQDLVAVHGDYGLGNLLWGGRSSPPLAVLDPWPAPFLDGFSARGRAPALIDLGLFVASLEGIHPLWRWRPGGGRRARACRDAFLDAYARSRRSPVDRAAVLRGAAAILRVYAVHPAPARHRGHRLRRRGWLRLAENLEEVASS